MAEVSLRALRAELAELRAQLAERARANVVLTEENAALRDHEGVLGKFAVTGTGPGTGRDPL